MCIIEGRDLRFDFVFPDPSYEFTYTKGSKKDPAKVKGIRGTGIAVEINGGIWGGIRMGHSSGFGIARDYEKNYLAQAGGRMNIRLEEKFMRKDDYAIVNRIIEMVNERRSVGAMTRRVGRPTYREHPYRNS